MKTEMSEVCPYCHGPLMEIDYHGEVLVGCVECNRWGKPGDQTLVMDPMEEGDPKLVLTALHPTTVTRDGASINDYCGPGTSRASRDSR